MHCPDPLLLVVRSADRCVLWAHQRRFYLQGAPHPRFCLLPPWSSYNGRLTLDYEDLAITEEPSELQNSVCAPVGFQSDRHFHSTFPFSAASLPQCGFQGHSFMNIRNATLYLVICFLSHPSYSQLLVLAKVILSVGNQVRFGTCLYSAKPVLLHSTPSLLIL